MSFSSSSDSSALPGLSLKKFVTQDEIDEKKKKRQEEWEKVRKPDDPEDCPEEVVDNRCLYDKLEEQRLKKQEEYEEQFAFRNQVRRLDEDEVEFLDFVNERQQDLSREKKREEAEIISEMKSAQVVKLTEVKQEEKKTINKPSQQTKRSQSALLAGAVRRKGSEETSPNKKPRLSSAESGEGETQPNRTSGALSDGEKTDNTAVSETHGSSSSQETRSNNVAKVVAVLPSVLPGMSQYEDSTDSQSSSSDSEPDFSLVGRNTTMIQKIQHSH